MNICVICPEIGNHQGNAFIGGGVNNAVRLAKGLTARGHRITIITTSHRHPGEQPASPKDGAEVHCLLVCGRYLSFVYGFLFAVMALLKVRALHHTKNFDIVHVHSGYAVMGLLTAMLKKITGIPAVHTLYCAPGRICDTRKRQAAALLSLSCLARIYLRSIDRIIAISNNIYNSLLSIGLPVNNLALISPGIDINIYNPWIKTGIRDQFMFAPEDPVVLYIGNLSEKKGLRILIESLFIVKQYYPGVKLLMVLNIPVNMYHGLNCCRKEDDWANLKEIKERIMEYGLNEQVIPIGFIPNMNEIMSASDVLVLPFLDISGIADYPISAIEAMACGKPLIATRIGGIHEIVIHRENGLLVNPGDVCELTDAILYLLSNKQVAQKMGARAFELASKRFRLETILNQYESIYREVGGLHHHDCGDCRD